MGLDCGLNCDVLAPIRGGSTQAQVWSVFPVVHSKPSLTINARSPTPAFPHDWETHSRVSFGIHPRERPEPVGGIERQR